MGHRFTGHMSHTTISPMSSMDASHVWPPAFCLMRAAKKEEEGLVY